MYKLVYKILNTIILIILTVFIILFSPISDPNINPNNDTGTNDRATESDMLGFNFIDFNNRAWRFDTLRKRGAENTLLIESEKASRQGLSIGNYGVLYKYDIKVSNSTNNAHSISYNLNTASTAIVRYKLENETNYTTKIKPSIAIQDDFTNFVEIYSREQWEEYYTKALNATETNDQCFVDSKGVKYTLKFLKNLKTFYLN